MPHAATPPALASKIATTARSLAAGMGPGVHDAERLTAVLAVLEADVAALAELVRAKIEASK